MHQERIAQWGETELLVWPFDRWEECGAARQMTVAYVLQNNRWISTIRGARSIPAITDLWDLLREIRIEEGEDLITWELTTDGIYSAKSAYEAFFTGRTRAPAAQKLWKAGAPLLHKLHLWFAMQNRLWTADRLHWRGLQHPAVSVARSLKLQTTILFNVPFQDRFGTHFFCSIDSIVSVLMQLMKLWFGGVTCRMMCQGSTARNLMH